MESGTILHLALLKKLSSASPKYNYINKFSMFRTVNSHQSHRTASSPQTSAQPFSKYHNTYQQLNFVRTKSHSLDDKRNILSKMQLQQSMNLCGWNVENEQQQDYKKYFKRTSHPVSTFQLKAPKRQPKRQKKQIKQKKFTYCEQNLDSFFKQIRLINTNTQQKHEQSRKQKPQKLKPLIIEDIKTQSLPLSSNRPVKVEKQNLLSEQLELISSHRVRKFRKKTKLHTANELLRDWNGKISRQRIC